MFVKIKLFNDVTPNRFYGPYVRVAASDPMPVTPEKLDFKGPIIKLVLDDLNIIIKGVRQVFKDNREFEKEEVIIVGQSKADIYLVSEKGTTIDVLWRARWAKAKN